MKKIIIICTFLGLTFGLNAQVNSNAIGLRSGGGDYGYGYEISYQKGIGSSNRFELDFGSRRDKSYGHLGITGIYHWVWNITSGLNWYAGPGAQIGLYNDRYSLYKDYIGLGVGGQIGIEFDFNELGAPILLSIDSRPMWDLNGYYSGDQYGFGGNLGIRYTF